MHKSNKLAYFYSSFFNTKLELLLPQHPAIQWHWAGGALGLICLNGINKETKHKVSKLTSSAYPTAHRFQLGSKLANLYARRARAREDRRALTGNYPEQGWSKPSAADGRAPAPPHPRACDGRTDTEAEGKNGAINIKESKEKPESKSNSLFRLQPGEVCAVPCLVKQRAQQFYRTGSVSRAWGI